jgi:hypothetical protein
MENIKFDLTKKYGNFRVMNAVNNGPIHKRHANDQARSNLEEYKAARIPYARNHDAAFCSAYGGEHTVDISAIFPNFDADPCDPASYDFACTDEYIAITLLAGTETFYRLGQKIEHTIKKFHVYPPKDFKKWAVICEHIILHYNYGWANGFEYGIKYWEIWNEPDLDYNKPSVRTWGGEYEEFCDLYETAAKYLKSRFPELKIGGPALCGNVEWAEMFLEDMGKRKVPIDFFSWHIYTNRAPHVVERAEKIKAAMIKNGYGDAESILNEWNYVRCWTKEFVYSIKQIIGMKGAAFTSAVMCQLQNNPDVDMLMYYDARPTAFNGLWDMYTYSELKGYYAFYTFANLYDLGTQVAHTSDDETVYVVAARNGNKAGAVVTYYTENDNENSKTVEINVEGVDMSNAKIYRVDENDMYSPYRRTSFVDGKLTIRMERNTILYIEA